MKYAYRDTNLRADTRQLIDQMNMLIDSYVAQGFRLSVPGTFRKPCSTPRPPQGAAKGAT